MQKLGMIVLLMLCVGCTRNADITLQEAKDIAAKQYQGEILEASLDDSNARSVYQIKIKKEDTLYQVTIDANDGKILADSIVDSSNPAKEETSKPQQDGIERISEQQAKEIALEKTMGGDVVKIEFDKADDPGEKDNYDIKIIKEQMEYELDIDAYTGEILKYEEEALHK